MMIMTGIDLHSNNALCGLMDESGKRLLHRKLPCDLDLIVKMLSPYKSQIAQVAVESTYNWYWLVDGLEDHGYPVVLANPAKIRQYDGLKHTNDVSDAFHLCELMRLGILPTSHRYNRQTRPVRDLLRRRMMLVQLRTSLILSFKSLHERTFGRRMALGEVKAISVEKAQGLFAHPTDQLLSGEQISLVGQFQESVAKIEKHVLAATKDWTTFQRVQELPGVGKILGLTIALETGEPTRFNSAGHFASYARCVKSQRESNQKKKGENNRKCGNRYLSWAFVEAAHFAARFDDQCRQFYDRKKKKTNVAVATKALACKLAKAAWHVMHDNVPYDPQRVFGAKKGGH
jgi:transposase